MSPRILIFSLAYFPHIGGAEVAIREITDRLPGFQFDMITLNLDAKLRKQCETSENAKFERVGNVNVFRIDCPKILFPFYAAWRARELHKVRDYQIVWGMMANLAGLGTLFFKLGNKAVKFLLTLQTGNDDRKVWKKTWWWRPLYKLIYRKADYIQAISNYLARRAKRMGARCPIEVVPNGADLKNFQFFHQRRIRLGRTIFNFQCHELRNELKIKDDDKVVVTASRLVRKNGIADLIRAVHLSFIIYHLSFKLLIAGVGELEGELRDLVRKLELEDRVKFLGQVSHSELPAYYQMADVFVRPSLSEGLGISFLEAMACGVPVIATPVGGIPDFLKDGETGWFCEPRDPESMAAKINYVLDERNRDEMKKVVERARKMVEEKYNWDKISGRMEEIFNRLKAIKP